jgi:hypothetical protein
MNKEETYDEKIAPLMKEIIATCKEHKIALLANFSLNGEENDNDLQCTTALLEPEYDPTPEQLQALALFYPNRRPPAHVRFTVRDKDGNVMHVDDVVVAG